MQRLFIVLLGGLLCASGCRALAGYDRASDDAGHDGVRDAPRDGVDDARVDGLTDATREGVGPQEAGRPDIGPTAMVFEEGCTLDNWCSTNHLPTPENLNGGYCLPNGMCYAVGAAGTVLVLEQNRWRREKTGTSVNLAAVWANGPHEVVAVGGKSILRFTGNQWSLEQIPGADLVAVWGSSSELYVTGPNGTWFDTGGGFIKATGDSRSVWGDGKGLALLGAASGQLTKLSNGTPTQIYTCGSQPIIGIWGRGATEVYALDDGGTLYLFDDQQCKKIDTAPKGAPFFSLYGQVVNGQVELVASGTGIVAQYDGTWYITTTAHDLHALAGDDGRGVRFGFGTVGSIYRRQGMDFVHANVPRLSDDLRGVAASGSVVRAVGTGLIASYTTTGWTVDRTTAPTVVFNGAWGRDKRAYAVGNAGAFYQLVPSVVSLGPSGNSLLRDVWSDASGSIFALSAASGCFVETSSGTESWPNTKSIRGVWGLSASEIYFVDAAEKTVLRYGGNASWKAELVTTTNEPWAIWGSDANNIFVGGDKGELHHKTAAGWVQTVTPPETSTNIRALVGRSATEVYAAGQAGAILRWADPSWARELSGTRALISDLTVDGQGNVWAVGNGGVILRKSKIP